MEALKRQRTSVKAAITRIQTFVSNNQNAPREVLVIRLKSLESSWLDYKRIHNEILVQCGDDTEAGNQEADYEQVELKYFELEAKLMELTNEINVEVVHTTSADVKLPRIELPVFSGHYVEWSSFRDLFLSIIHNNQRISASQKLHYLKSSLSGEAAGLLQSMEITEANYAEAWGLLQERYQDQRQLVQCHIKALMGHSSRTEESPGGIRNLLDNTVKHIRALNALGIETDTWDPMLVFVVTEKLDNETRRQWELNSPSRECPPFNELKGFLEQRCRALEASGARSKGKATMQSTNTYHNNKGKVSKASHHSTSTSGRVEHCILCQGDHSIYKCSELMKLSDKEKFATVRKYNLCFNCLKKNHSAQQCKSESRCCKCGSKHHTILHVDRGTLSVKPVEESVLNHFSKKPNGDQVLLSTAVIKVKDNMGNQQQCRAILDSGSQASFVTEDCVQRLGLKRTKANVSIIGIGQTGSGMSKGLVSLYVGSNASDFSITVDSLIMSKLTSYTPNVFIKKEQWAHLDTIKLADPLFGKTGPIDIILGAEVFGELLLQGRISGTEGCPSAFNAQFGWVLSGRVGASMEVHQTVVNFAQLEDQDQLRKFWELEEIITKKHLTPEEQLCEEHFCTTYSRDQSGRYQVNLPRREGYKSLGQSKAMAVNRLCQVERRLKRKSKEYSEMYGQFLEQYLELGHMETVPTKELEEVMNKTNYLPHHYVMKEDSTSTKLRVVFDASAKTSSGVSLNDQLLVGPKLQDDMWDILLRFRMHRYAITADIEKMYRQIRVSPNDADLQRIVWREAGSDPVQEFRITTVAFGTASAPYLATKVLQQLAHDEGEQFPLAKEIVLKDFYVDDLMSGVNTIDEGIKVQSQLLYMLKKGGFLLKKWSSNEPTLLESLPEEYRETKLPLKMGQMNQLKH